MVFVKGMLVGGASELKALMDGGEFKALLANAETAVLADLTG
jgi:glutaredoxin-related protein